MPGGKPVSRGLASLTLSLIGVALIAPGVPALAQSPNQIVQQTCVACHNEYTLMAGLNLQGFDAEHKVSAASRWLDGWFCKFDVFEPREQLFEEYL